MDSDEIEYSDDDLDDAMDYYGKNLSYLIVLKNKMTFFLFLDKIVVSYGDRKLILQVPNVFIFLKILVLNSFI